LGYSPDHRTLAVVSIGSNSVTFIDTATNAVRHVTYVGRSPHKAFFTPDGREVWVTVRGENYVSVIDGKTFTEKTRIITPGGPGMQIFSPDGKYGYICICSSFNPEMDVVTVDDHKIIAKVKQESPFCPNIAATPDGRQVWFTLKDVGKTQVFNAKPPFNLIKTIDTGPITNHVNFAHTSRGSFAYVTIGGLNQVKVTPMIFLKSRPSRSAVFRTVYGRRAMAAGSMSGWRMATRSPRSTPQPTPSSPTFRSDKRRRRSPMFRTPPPIPTIVKTFRRSVSQARSRTLRSDRRMGQGTDKPRPASRCSIKA
jgi:YVTN family beta-propeller protein